jgi:hypothetical protein
MWESAFQKGNCRHKVALALNILGLRELDLYGVKGCNSPYQPLAIPKSRMLTGIQAHWSSARAKLTRFCCSLRMKMDVGWGADQGSMQRRSVTLAYPKARVY